MPDDYSAVPPLPPAQTNVPAEQPRTTSSTPDAKEGMGRYRCPSCGSSMEYSPVGGVLKCPHCGHTEVISQSDKRIFNYSYNHYAYSNAAHTGVFASNALEVTCQACGAKTVFEPPEVAGRCPFCGVPIIGQPQSANPVVAPSAVLPF